MIRVHAQRMVETKEVKGTINGVSKLSEWMAFLCMKYPNNEKTKKIIVPITFSVNAAK